MLTPLELLKQRAVTLQRLGELRPELHLAAAPGVASRFQAHLSERGHNGNTIPTAETAPARTSLDVLFRARAQIVYEDDDPRTFSEIRRICALPIVRPLAPEEHEEFCRQHILATHFEKGWRFFEPQAAGMMAYRSYHGLFGPIGVGWGKTLLCLWISNEAFQNGLHRTLYLVPPQVYAQLVKRDIPWARQRVPISVPFHYMGQKSAAERNSIAKSGRRGCYILPHSCLSTKDSTDLLKLIHPNLLVIDEAHQLKNRRAARTRRVVDYISHNQPQVVAVSGTMTSKSIMDYFHLIKAALGNNSPLPLTGQLAAEWASVIDSDASPTEYQFKPITPIVEWSRKNFPGVEIPFGVSGFRKAYRMRLTTAPGVVATSDNDIGVSLIIANLPAESNSDNEKLEKLIKDVETLYLTPNGDEIEHAIHCFKWLYELSAGFYNELIWPTPEALATKLQVTYAVAARRLEVAKTHHFAKQKFSKLERSFFADNQAVGMDTPMLLGQHLAKHGGRGVPGELFEAWEDMKAIEAGEGALVERDSRVVRVCDYKIQHAVKWVTSPETRPDNDGAIVWVYHQEMGVWVMEALRAAGVDALHCPAGNVGNELICDPANAQRVCVASIKAHGEGKNLQHFQRQLMLQWTRSAKDAEQLLGRTHRNGQEADELVPYRCDTTLFDQLLFAACVNDALYISQTTGVRQRLVYAGYSPLPPIFPPEALRERGFQNEMLSPEQWALLQERFSVSNPKESE